LAEKTHHFTLLDGEMIIDTLPESQKQERRYLIYDLMAINQVSVIEVKEIVSLLLIQCKKGSELILLKFYSWIPCYSIFAHQSSYLEIRDYCY